MVFFENYNLFIQIYLYKLGYFGLNHFNLLRKIIKTVNLGTLGFAMRLKIDNCQKTALWSKLTMKPNSGSSCNINALKYSGQNHFRYSQKFID